jgi:hypothetical protein
MDAPLALGQVGKLGTLGEEAHLLPAAALAALDARLAELAALDARLAAVGAVKVQTTEERLVMLANVAETGGARWVAGDEALLDAALGSSASGRMTWNNWRRRFGRRAGGITGLDVHHWLYKSLYPAEMFNPENLYILGKPSHTGYGGIHTAIGQAGAPTKFMAWGVEPEVQSMFNFWIAEPVDMTGIEIEAIDWAGTFAE